MKLPKGLPNDVVLRTWMAHGKANDSDKNSASFVSPILKAGSNGVHPHVVTLSLRPFRTTNLSVDSFMAAHSPRRNNNSKQKFMLKPLDQRNCSANIHTTFGKEALDLSVASSRTRDQERIPHGRSDIRTDRPYSNCSSQSRGAKASPSVIACSEYDSTFSPKQYNAVPDSLYTIRNNSFRPPPRISHLTGQKITFGNTFGFNYHTGYLNLFQTQTDLVAKGTPVSTIGPKQTQATKPTPRWQMVKSALNEKGCKYADPMLGCSPGFQARMAEITQHELDTVKWEKGKKGKKKSSSG